jgi:DNA-binding NtrC family response regulator
MHALVSAFVGSDLRLVDLLPRFSGRDDPIVSAMVKLSLAFTGQGSIEEALLAAQKAPVEPADPDLLVLFYCQWAEGADRLGRTSEMTAVVGRARSLITAETPPEIRAVLIGYEADVAGARGDFATMERLQEEAEGALPPGSPRGWIAAIGRAHVLACLGRATEMEDQLERILSAGRTSRRRGGVALVRLIQFAETGRCGEARDQLSIIEGEPLLAAFFDETVRRYRALLDLMQSRPEDDPRNEVCRHLLARRIDPALLAARERVRSDPDHYARRMGFDSYDLIRAELAAGHADAARRLLDGHRERGNRRHFDDLFYFRIALLSGDEDRAASHLRQLLSSVDRYRAEGRLDFELRLAHEIPPSRLVRMGRATAQERPAPSRPAPAPRAPKLVGPSPAMAAVRRSIREFAPLDAPVLITGETGTGKELVARALHAESPRAGRPFVVVNCGAIAESLLESELFGHQRGAFTGAVRSHPGLFEQAADGTILLDEIGEISPALMVALLRVLESGEFRAVGGERVRAARCRVLASTNADLDDLVRQKRFRPDLLYRLRRLEIRIPPLRERVQDILPLAEHFLSLDRSGPTAALSGELKVALVKRPWRGNVRELKNEIERMRLLNSDRSSYDLAHLEAAPTSPPTEEDQVLLEGRSPLRRLKRLRDLFLKHKELTRREIAQLLRVTPETITQDLKRLRSEGFIDRVEPSRSPRSHYFVLRTPRPS